MKYQWNKNGLGNRMLHSLIRTENRLLSQYLIKL